jgi:hypothetical protein
MSGVSPLSKMMPSSMASNSMDLGMKRDGPVQAAAPFHGSLVDVVNELETVSIPTDGKSLTTNSLTSTEAGELLLLSGEGDIVRCNIRPTSTKEKLMESLKFNLNVDFKQYNNILSNTDGSLLVIWSIHHVAIIEVTQNSTTCDVDDACIFHQLHVLDDNNISIVDIKFHPLSKYTIVVLYECRYLVAWNLRDLTSEGRQVYTLPSHLYYTSFCYGTSITWLYFTVFLSTKSDIYALCPIIPKGILLPSTIAYDLWNWYITTSTTDCYWNIVRQTLIQAFGTAVLDTSPISALSYLMTYSSCDDSVGREDADPLSICTVYLQGPLTVLRDAHRGSSRSLLQGGASIADMNTPYPKYLLPSPTASTAPVLMVAYSSGEVEVLLLDLQVSSMRRGDQLLPFPKPAWSCLLHVYDAMRSDLI